MNFREIWQVEVRGQIYEADNVEEIIEWISEGSVLAEDKVRKGSLRWITAAKVPELNGYFHENAFESNSTVSVNVTDASEAAFLAVSENDILIPDNSMSDASVIGAIRQPFPCGELELNNLKREKFYFSDAVQSLIIRSNLKSV